MIIKKFQADTEAKAIMLAKEEMGSSAIVLNIKSMKHKGLARLFRKDSVEVTAALEEKSYNNTTGNIPVKRINLVADETSSLEVSEKKTNAIEEKLNNLQSMLENQMQNEVKEAMQNKSMLKEEKETKVKSINFTFLQLIYNQLLDNEVNEKYANQIIAEIEATFKKETTLDTILSSVYQKIVLKLGQPKSITPANNKAKLVFFIGPTGVGKTTTIAKLASDFKLQKKAKVALITSDTYRIAAVEQLRTYANILDIPLQVVYTTEELNTAIKLFEGYDYILFDTAGRSHKNKEQCEEMADLIKEVEIDKERVEKEVCLVLSAATKYKDLIKITEVFGNVGEYSIIFTKLDETTSLGNILNIKLLTGVQLSYVTSGQVVPDDICALDPQKVARSILGGKE